MTDIPLRAAQVIWNPRRNPELSPVRVVKIPGNADDQRYDSSWGACNGDFAEADDREKVNMLFKHYHQLVTFDNIPAATVHDAFMVIPEYRRALIDFGTLDPALA